ncbi:hypothetical protein EH223_06050 [candidate division KSB1 bacterium]|nr:hypothetical protein [candidate division KSB1 bacterium]RQW05001.1 MAG: hypothetical protein EH223_06050 [candidate division KSB1 bacterium]
MKKMVIALIGIVIGGFTVGFTVGKLRSPDYNNQENILRFIYSHITPGQVDGGAIVCILTCGARTYTYHSALDTIIIEYGSPFMTNKQPVRRKYASLNLNLLYSIAGGGPTAIIGGTKFIDYLSPLTKNQKVMIGLIAVATTLSGVYWGYRLGYSNDIDCSSDQVQNILHDKKMWQTYVQYRVKNPAIGVTLGRTQ